jgi:hypothetical protein
MRLTRLCCLTLALWVGAFVGCDQPKPKAVQTPAKMIDPPKEGPKPAGG